MTAKHLTIFVCLLPAILEKLSKILRIQTFILQTDPTIQYCIHDTLAHVSWNSQQIEKEKSHEKEFSFVRK